ncbi:MAG: hypothetical protein J0H40_16940 [Rhizobiales bacterium]|nr:hypothetical protein [Hyphomicrobiales bacterium]
MEWTLRRGPWWPFWGIWASYFFLLALSGSISRYPNFSRAVVYELAFVVFVSAPLLLLPSSSQIGPWPTRLSLPRLERHGLALIFSGLGISAIALVSLFIDRMIQGIDYTHGACIAREQMTQLGLLRSGVSSPFSVIGQLFGYTFFVPVAVVMMWDVTRKLFWVVMSSAFLLLMVQSELAASRSTIMLFGTFVLAMIGIRTALGGCPRLRQVDLGMSVALGAIAIGFILYVFVCRADASNMSPQQYARSFESYLGVKRSILLPTTDQPGEIGKISGVLAIAVMYATHSAFTFAGLLTRSDSDSLLLFSGPRELLSKVGIHLGGAGQTDFSGRFPSLPGALYHDFGLPVMLATGVLLGIAMWGAMVALRVFPGRVFVIGAASAIYIIAYLSPLMFAVDIMAFPFICFGFVIIPLAMFRVGQRRAAPRLEEA